MVFIAYSLTVWSYGDSFYVKRRDKIGEPWLWKSVIATILPRGSLESTG